MAPLDLSELRWDPSPNTGNLVSKKKCGAWSARQERKQPLIERSSRVFWERPLGLEYNLSIHSLLTGSTRTTSVICASLSASKVSKKKVGQRIHRRPILAFDRWETYTNSVSKWWKDNVQSGNYDCVPLFRHEVGVHVVYLTGNQR